MTILTPPPSRIYLMRHAQSRHAQPGERDFDRPLDEKGFAEAERISDLAADRRYVPDLVLSSTAVRCRQTAEAIQRAFGPELDILYVDDLYAGSVATYIDILDAQDSRTSVLLIGHNPAMEELTETLAGADTVQKAMPEGYPTGGFAVLDHNGAHDGRTNSNWLLRDLLRL